MIEAIRSEEEIHRLLKICKDNPDSETLTYANFNLPSKSIQNWIMEGKFKHLKNELSIYNNIKFGCLKNELGCQYFFFGNRQATYRILNLLSGMFDNKNIRLQDCKSNQDWENSEYNTDDVRISGEFNACPLF